MGNVDSNNINNNNESKLINNNNNLWLYKNYISVNDLHLNKIIQLFKFTNLCKKSIENNLWKNSLGPCNGRILTNVFYEPSTRTSCSFNAAMLRLGGKVISVNSNSSSVKKGETLEDTMRCLELYSDIVVLRHPEKGSSIQASKAMKKPLINAGDGAGEHPTQALLDLYTIVDELKTHDINTKYLNETKLNIILLGDLKYGRTVHSLVKVLKTYYSKNIKLFLISPKELKMPDDIIDYIKKNDIDYVEDDDLKKYINVADVLYVTRIQKERFLKNSNNKDEFNEDEFLKKFIVNKQLLKNAKKTLTILHPLPRVKEIATEVDNDPRAAYFRQMLNGMYVRMALIGLILGDF